MQRLIYNYLAVRPIFMRYTGESVPRLDAISKVSGDAKYISDISFSDMLYGAVYRSKKAHARIIAIHFDDAFDWSKVTVVTSVDIPGKNCITMVTDDLVLLVDNLTKHVGEAIVLIAANTLSLAKNACQHIHVEYDELNAVLDLDASKSANTVIHGSDNIIAHYHIDTGNTSQSFKKSDIICEEIYEMGAQDHMYIEPQGMIAMPNQKKGFDVIGSMQCPYYISAALANLMDMDESQLSIKQSVVGGAFGGKEDYPSILAGYCVLLSHKSGKPVKMIYDRAEDCQVTTKRHPARIRIKSGLSKQGKLLALDITMELNAGAYTTLTPVVLSRGLLHVLGSYRCDSVCAKAIAYATNTPPNGAFRGFGAPQAFFAFERHVDIMANALHMTPHAFRKKNYLRPGDTMPMGQQLSKDIASKEVLESALVLSDFSTKYAKFNQINKQKSHIRRGIGMALFYHGAGFTGAGEVVTKKEAILRFNKEGLIDILTASTEMGQGAHTVLPQIVADHLGINMTLLDLIMPDTAIVPNSGPTVASRTTMIVGSILQKCADKLRSSLCEFIAEKYHYNMDDILLKNNHVMHKRRRICLISDAIKDYVNVHDNSDFSAYYTLPKGLSWDEKTFSGDAYPTYAWGCDIAEVEVNMRTFEVRVTDIWAVCDVGKAIHPMSVEGQIEGGTLQALGYGIMENGVTNSKGQLLSDRFQNYIIPTFPDTPRIHTTIIEKPFAHSPMGAKGLGELPMDGGAPAVVNALCHALSLDINQLPVLPENILYAWKDAHDHC